jgi:hypothetical protein
MIPAIHIDIAKVVTEAEWLMLAVLQIILPIFNTRHLVAIAALAILVRAQAAQVNLMPVAAVEPVLIQKARVAMVAQLTGQLAQRVLLAVAEAELAINEVMVEKAAMAVLAL